MCVLSSTGHNARRFVQRHPEKLPRTERTAPSGEALATYVSCSSMWQSIPASLAFSNTTSTTCTLSLSPPLAQPTQTSRLSLPAGHPAFWTGVTMSERFSTTARLVVAALTLTRYHLELSLKTRPSGPPLLPTSPGICFLTSAIWAAGRASPTSSSITLTAMACLPMSRAWILFGRITSLPLASSTQLHSGGPTGAPFATWHYLCFVNLPLPMFVLPWRNHTKLSNFLNLFHGFLL